MSSATSATSDSEAKDARWSALLVVALSLVFCAVLVRTAWVSDDALITLRTVRNLLAGEGLRWNLVERVQTFSHPLWMWLLAAASLATREYYLTTLVLGALTTLGALAIALRSSVSYVAAALLLTACIASSAFVDYATSGLENPFTHLTLALLVWLHTPAGRDRDDASWHRWLGVAAGLATFNRLDAALLFAPALLAALWRARSLRALRDLSIGFLPLVAWETFALVYYGFPFPNTAYAKLGAGLPRLELGEQGLRYLLESARHDPTTVGVVAAAVGVSVATAGGRASRNLLAPACAGALLYLGYVVSIGGDFMAGRFLTAPFFLCLCALAASNAAPRTWRGPSAAIAVAALLLLGALTRAPRLLTGADFARLPRLDRISDERSVYFQRFGWWSHERRGRTDICEDMEAFAGPVSVRGSIGQRGFCEPADHHIIDRNGLGDPLLARLPARPKPPLEWQPGHLTRGIPAGYRESIETGENRIEDNDLRHFYEVLLEVTRGEPLLERRRLASIWALNTGRYDATLAQPRFAQHPARSTRALEPTAGDAAAWRWTSDRAGGFEVPRDGLDLTTSPKIRADSLVLVRSAGRILGVDFLANGELLARVFGESANASGPVVIPEDARAAGFDTLRIHPGPVKPSQMHHLRLRADRGGAEGLLMLDSVELRAAAD